MSSEIVVSETPNWLQELEAKRERRVKARLGHEAGAGAPCLKCSDKCPGLDLHFWRKCCKICKCSKEEHEVQDDDIYGWAQFQLLGSKPNKIKMKISLHGKNDEIDLEWVPKGHNDIIDKYLKTLPPEQLPVKGSQAAQDRKQLLQKQIPIHDIDPALCHELTEDELKKMNEYIAHVKQNSAGVGQIVSLSNIIKGKLHMLNPAEAAIIANRYGKGVPISEMVKLQAQSKSGGLGRSLDKLSLKNNNLQQFHPTTINKIEDHLNPLVSTKIHDKDYPLYSTDMNQTTPNAQFSADIGPKQFKNVPTDQNQIPLDQTIDKKYLQNPNFDPKNRPSNFIGLNSQYNPTLQRDILPSSNSPLDYDSANSAFVPYQKLSTAPKSGDTYLENNSLVNPNVAKDLQRQNKPPYLDRNSLNIMNNYNVDDNQQLYENATDMKKSSSNLPNYAVGKFNTYTETQSPTKVPKNFKDLAFSTYEPGTVATDPSENENGFKLGKYRQPGSFADDNKNIPKNSNGFRPIEPGSVSNVPRAQQYGQTNQQVDPMNPNMSEGLTSRGLSAHNATFEPLRTNKYGSSSYPANSTKLTSDNLIAHQENFNQPGSMVGAKPGYFGEGLRGDQNENPLPNMAHLGSTTGRGSENLPSDFTNSSDPNSRLPTFFKEEPTGYSGRKPSELGSQTSYNISNPLTAEPNNKLFDQNQRDLERAGDRFNKYADSPLKSNKQLSELHPSDLRINEDFLNPSQVNIGLIQDINYPEIKTATQEAGDFYEEYSPESIKEILNNVILPDCHYCKKPFKESEFAVTIDRANVLFHSGCFKCAGCNQILADNFYFYNKETDNVYCLRDYAKIRGFPRCKACDELIFTKEYCLAENSTFHLKHFCCTQCDMPLAGQDYTLEDEMPYCLPCFEQNKASKCNTCGKVIKPDEVGCNLNGIHFHAVDACFACKVCQTPLMGKRMLLRNDKLYCSHQCFQTDQ